MHIFERNSVARILIVETGPPSVPPSMTRLEPEIDVSRLVAFKCLGLLAAADILEWMVKKNTTWSRLVVYTMAAIQTSLLFYLVT